MVTARLHAALRVSYLLQHASRFLHILRKQILLVRNLRQQHRQLVAYLANGIVVGALAPFAELGGDTLRFTPCGLESPDSMVFGLDQLVKTLGELWLLQAAQTAHGETMFWCRFLATFALLRADGGGTVPCET